MCIMTEQRHPIHSPDELLRRAWAELAVGASGPRHGWQLPVFSNIDASGRPESRTVVLRSADPDQRALSFHTDRRSPKVPAIMEHPQVSLVFYDRESKTQLRVNGRASVHLDDEVADAAWARTALSSRRCYLAPDPPSDVTPEWRANLPEELHRAAPESDQSELGRVNFAVIRTTVDEMEQLELHHDGHVRCRWTWLDGEVESAWLAP